MVIVVYVKKLWKLNFKNLPFLSWLPIRVASLLSICSSSIDEVISRIDGVRIESFGNTGDGSTVGITLKRTYRVQTGVYYQWTFGIVNATHVWTWVGLTDGNWLSSWSVWMFSTMHLRWQLTGGALGSWLARGMHEMILREVHVDVTLTVTVLDRKLLPSI